MAGTQVRRIDIRVNATGDGSLRSVKNSFKELNQTVKASKESFDSFKFSFQSLIGASVLGFGIRELVGVTDSIQKLNDRLVNSEGSTEKAAITLGKLRDIANYTNSSIEDLATVYSRLDLSLSEAGLNTDALLGLTLSLQQSFRLSGSTAAEATASIIQLSQGLASGQLRGQELRSVLEQNAVFGEILAKQLGKTRGELLKFAEKEGGIKARDVLIALADNFEKLNDRAQKLQPTIGETLTKSFNDLKFSLNEVNKEFGLTAIASEGIESVFNNLGKTTLILAGTFIYLKRVAIGAAFTSAVTAVTSALATLGTTIVILLSPLYIVPVAIGLVVAAIIAAIGYFIGFNKAFESTVGAVSKFVREYLEYIGALEKKVSEPLQKISVDMTVITKKSQDLFDVIKGPGNESVDELGKNLSDLGVFAKDAKDPLKVMADALRDAAKAMGGGAAKAVDYKKLLSNLNESFSDGKIGVLAYNAQLLVLTEKLNGRKGPVVQAAALAKIMRENLNREFEYGVLNLEEFNSKLNGLKLEQLTASFNAGRISVAEYNKELLEVSKNFEPNAAIYTGINNYIESSGTLSQNIAKNITLVFNTLEDTLVEFVRNGTFEFSKFTKAVLDDLARIIIRASIIQPLASGLLGAINPNRASGDFGLGVNANGSSTSEGGFANGGAFNKGVQFYASGGVVNRTTGFGMSGGRMGIMGEAGPEAILPLSRGPGGKLGVSGGGSNVQVNIINNSGAEISQQETTNSQGDRVLDILIGNKVKESVQSGALDKTFNSRYGMKPRGQ